MEEFEKLIKACGEARKENIKKSVIIPNKEFVDEHKKLVKTLKSGSKEEQKKEAEDQEEELKNELKKAESGKVYGDPIGTVKTFKGGQYVKIAAGKWVPYKGPSKPGGGEEGKKGPEAAGKEEPKPTSPKGGGGVEKYIKTRPLSSEEKKNPENLVGKKVNVRVDTGTGFAHASGVVKYVKPNVKQVFIEGYGLAAIADLRMDDKEVSKEEAYSSPPDKYEKKHMEEAAKKEEEKKVIIPKNIYSFTKGNYRVDLKVAATSSGDKYFVFVADTKTGHTTGGVFDKKETAKIEKTRDNVEGLRKIAASALNHMLKNKDEYFSKKEDNGTE